MSANEEYLRQELGRVVEEAIAVDERIRTRHDPDLMVDALYGPLFLRWVHGRAPLDEDFAEALANKIIHAIAP